MLQSGPARGPINQGILSGRAAPRLHGPAAAPAPVARSSHARAGSAHEDCCSGLFFGGMYLIYGVLSVVALCLASPFLIYQAVRHRKYVRSLRQRLGYLPL